MATEYLKESHHYASAIGTVTRWEVRVKDSHEFICETITEKTADRIIAALQLQEQQHGTV